MPSASRSGFVVLAACAAAWTGCSSGASAPQTCSVDAECPSSARCVSSACVANAPPLPAVVLPAGPLETNVLLSFDGSGSADPDGGDSVVAHAWSFRALSADCAPPVVAGTEPLASVRFSCPGRYAVDLTVTDEMPASATATKEFDVVAYSGPALVTVGEDLALEHLCTSLPTRCAPEGEIVLSAAAPGFAPGDVSFEWSAEPPASRPLDANRRVTFSPGPLVQSPSVSIETDGQAISGDWIFRVRVRDSAGLIGTAAVRVSVKNRLPVVQETIPAVGHLFAAGVFTASGEIPYTVTDPDGDALVGPTVEWRHAGDGGGAFSGGLAGGPNRVTFEIAVPYTSPGDALHLIGAPDLERTIAFAMSDVNGGQASETWPIVVGNRPPALGAVPAPFTVEHRYDPVALAYEADAPLSAWSDPDGDPLFQVPSADTGDPLCPAVAIADGVGARVATASCALGYTGFPAVANFAGAHSVMQTIQDPWTPAAQASTVTFTIANSAPVVVAPTGPVVVTQACLECPGDCGIPGEPLPMYCATAITIQVPSGASDPDGDPILVSAPPNDGLSLADTVCGPGDACSLAVSAAPVSSFCDRKILGPLGFTATDGSASTGPTALEVWHECGW